MGYILGSIATVQTSAVLLGIGFAMNMYICLKLIYLKKKRPMEVYTQIGLLQDLVINEMIEFMVPPIYLATLLLAFYGPNAEIIGNVKNGYWRFTPIADINHTIEFVIMFFFIDICNLFISAFLLWTFARINLYRAFVEIQKEFGLPFLFQIGAALSHVSLLEIDWACFFIICQALKYFIN